MRSPRNKTLMLDENECEKLKNRLLHIDRKVRISAIRNKTINGNLLELIDFLPNEFADLIIIDPPYNLEKNFNGYNFKSMSKNDYTEYLRSWLPKVCSKLKPNGSLYLCGDWKCSSAMETALSENLTIINRITWQREKGRGATKNWKNAMEDIWFAVKNIKNYYFDVGAVKTKRKVNAPYKIDGQPKDWEMCEDGNFRLTYPSNFWDDISIPYWSMPENTEHPTQKPEKLIAKLILASTEKGGMVFDPFLGSGTTSVVAKKLGRKYCGVEMNAEYCCWAEYRLNLAEKDARIQGYCNNVFWERNTSTLQKNETKCN